MPVWLVGRQTQDRCAVEWNVSGFPYPWSVNLTQSSVTVLRDCSLTWATDGGRLTRAGGTVIPRFQQNVCDHTVVHLERETKQVFLLSLQ